GQRMGQPTHQTLDESPCLRATSWHGPHRLLQSSRGTVPRPECPALGPGSLPGTAPPRWRYRRPYARAYTATVGSRRRHPSLALGRPELAAEWDSTLNGMGPEAVALGSSRRAFWQ